VVFPSDRTSSSASPGRTRPMKVRSVQEVVDLRKTVSLKAVPTGDTTVGFNTINLDRMLHVQDEVNKRKDEAWWEEQAKQARKVLARFDS